jgi:glutathione S-transferase
LVGHDWLVGSGCTTADIGLYAYTHVAHEGGYDLSKYPGISRWRARIAAMPRHVPLEWRP